jgi:hypothetical protein
VPLLRLRSVQVFYNRDDELKKLLALADGLPQGKVENLALRGGVARMGAGRHQFADENLWGVDNGRWKAEKGIKCGLSGAPFQEGKSEWDVLSSVGIRGQQF